MSDVSYEVSAQAVNHAEHSYAVASGDGAAFAARSLGMGSFEIQRGGIVDLRLESDDGIMVSMLRYSTCP